MNDVAIACGAADVQSRRNGLLRRGIDFLLQRIEGRKAVKQLAKLDDRMLKDIGLVRGDVDRLLLSDQPEHSLQELEYRLHGGRG